MNHQPVMLKESLEALQIHPHGIYVDGTFGRGGHSRAILEQLSDQGLLIAIDKDPEAVDFAQINFGQDRRFKIFHGSFAEAEKFTQELGLTGKINGIILDLGVSSPQLDDPQRGFSFYQGGPLDMRMNLAQSYQAADFINEAKVSEMADLFKTYGEERFAKRIARAIALARDKAPIQTTAELSEIVKRAHPKWERHKHPATKVFQALRIHVNQELEDLKLFLASALNLLAVGGRLVVLSFHSLEDRIVKRFMRDQEKGEPTPAFLPLREQENLKKFKRVGKAIKPSEQEIEQNTRARSAVLRIGEKLS